MPGDPYADGTAAWWHLSRPSPELLQALDSGWLRAGMRVLDLGCGLGTDIAHLARLGFDVVGVDISREAVARARAAHPNLNVLIADVRQLPFEANSFDYLLDRGCFHYLVPADRKAYAREAERVLRPRGELLLRACLRAAGRRNDINERTLSSTFSSWTVVSMETASIPSDTRSMEALITRLERSSAG